ncbi:FAD linked oxidase domain protein [Geobacter metallireducens RCH3]|uniref:p-cresol methylhydroxylase, alpha subunit n=1 Tax=Geobacter metallireducens (strain ATCC 53774 / DSM 7210 / GS-15) TaxID=269799 RepID=Q39TR9_GEOMG|nr:FAD-binding oxidoreductase [Geobacter metallireducens]ABB32355.1 p-cresol methylhydroxylase, alpha subunit [Geobacter metallireducens GS-15]EHP86755.1 FAD linked oxidase domain protein [Geobacter metallireducens RCH3]
MSRYLALPKGVTEAAFTKAITEYRTLLGEGRVRTDLASLSPYIVNSIAESDSLHTPSAAIYPTTTREIQSIVGIANKYKTPLWTVCNGENEGYGSSAPATAGQIVLDLRNMKKIIEVDRELGYCLVEPGVTYADLQNYLTSNKINLWLDAPAPSANVSILGNILERGSGYTPYSEDFLFSCGMEVVLANGTVLKTGMGGIPNSTSWQVFKWGFGPYVDGLFSQGNNGIVTKVGAWLMGAPPPGGYKPFCIRFPKNEMLPNIIKPLMFLRQAQIVPNACALVNAGWETATRFANDRRNNGRFINTANRVIPANKLVNRNVGAWNLYGAVYGSPEQVALNWMYVSGTFKQAFGNKISIITENEAKGDPAFEYRKQLMMGGVTSRNPLDSWRPGYGSMKFAPTAAARPGECAQQAKVAAEIINRHGFDYLSEFSFFWYDARHTVDLRFDRTRPEEMKRAHACFNELISAFAKHGWAVGRTNTAFMDKVADSYGPAKQRLNRTIKKALDPNNILSPGKSGITAG